jgi:mevalonyl-CoA ligase
MGQLFSRTEEPLAVVNGSSNKALWSVNLESVLHERATQYNDRPAVIFPWQNKQLSFSELHQRAKIVAASLLCAGVKHGDCIGIIAGNRYEYLEVFVGGALVGCKVLVLNNTYRPRELEHALKRTGMMISILKFETEFSRSSVLIQCRLPHPFSCAHYRLA